MADNVKAAKKLNLAISLEEQSLYHVHFLKAVDSRVDLKNPALLRRALFRYERFWLPLAAEHVKEKLTAPLDIEWMWHCHMLCPTAYVKDCNSVVGKVIDHTLKSIHAFKAGQDHTRKLWAQMYPEEPFDIGINDSFDSREMENFISKISYSLLAAAERQGLFYYQVSLPHFLNSKFLHHALQRYKQFLYMKTKLPKEFLVPCYDIDLIWHSHQLNPLAYGKDMDHIIGHLFNHDDTVNDRSEGSKLAVADNKTREHWKSFYNENFALFGAMYRGMPPQGFLYQITRDEMMSFTTKKCDITFDSISLHHPDMSAKTWKNYVIDCVTAAGNKNAGRWFRTQGSAGTFDEQQLKKTWTKLGTFHFLSKKENNLLFDAQEKVGFAFCKSKTVVGKGTLNMLSFVENYNPGAANDGSTISKTIQMGQATVDVKLLTSPIKPDASLLFLDQGKYENSIIPENIKQLWGPVALERLPAGVDNKCQVATHGYVYSYVTIAILIVYNQVNTHKASLRPAQSSYCNESEYKMNSIKQKSVLTFLI